MLGRFSLTFFFLFFSNNFLGAEEQGGMPQLNPESFSSQIFWLFATFSILFLVIHFFLLPKLKKIREKREETISDYLSQTQKLNKQIDDLITQIDQELNKAKISFNNKIKEELDKDQQKLIKMSFFEQKSHKKIAEELEIPLGTVKSRIRTTLNKMYKFLS